MQDLFRRSSFLFWQYPILWVPVALSDLIAFATRQLQTRVTRTVVATLAEHSVLTGTSEPINHVPNVLAIGLGAARTLVEFFNICLYAAAMLAISVFVRALAAKISPDWREAFLAIKERSTRILFFSVKTLALIAVTVVIGVLALSHFLMDSRFTRGSEAAALARDYGTAAAVFSVVAGVVAPSAVALLRPRQSPPINRTMIHYSRIYAMLTTLASVATFTVCVKLEPSFFPRTVSSIGVEAYWAIVSVITAIPYVFLFITLSLIAATDSPVSFLLMEIVEDTPSAAQPL